MNDIPAELKYTQNHEWLRASGQGRYVVGITDHAQVSLGEVIFVDLPAVGESFIAGENCAVTESAKAASDVYAPVSGTIVAVNEALESTPDLVNRAPYGEGWFFIMQVDDAEDESELEILMDAEAYQCFLEEQQEEI